MFVPYKPYNRTSYDDGGTPDLLRRIDHCIEKISDTSSTVPHRDKNAHSECPFADQLYDDASGWIAEGQDQRRQAIDHAAAAQNAAELAKQKERDSHLDDDPRHCDDWKDYREEAANHRGRRDEILAKIAEFDECVRKAERTIASRQEA